MFMNVLNGAIASSLTAFHPPMLAALPIDGLLSTQGIMVLLLVAYAGAMWMFLNSAPKVFTVMVTDLDIARQFYEGMLELPTADVPLQYYYNYDQTMGAAAADPLYMSAGSLGTTATMPEGLWYQLRKNTQLHVISGANHGHRDRQRHVCFDHDCLEQIFLRVQTRRLRYKLRREKPLNFLVKDYEGRVIEFAEISN